MADIFWGFVYDRERERRLLRDSRWGVPTAVNQYQKGFLAGLGQKLHIFSVAATGTFPKTNRRLFFKGDTAVGAYGNIEYLPFINFYFLKDFCVRRQLLAKTRALLRQSTAPVTLYIYSLYMPFLRAAQRLKRQYGKRLSVCLIITDLPGKYGVLRRWYTPGGLRDRFEARQKMAGAAVADRYVFVTEQMRRLFLPKPATVIEGFLPENTFDYTADRVPKSILYTGSLNEKYGIDTLLAAFSGIADADYRLWICGGGASERVRAAAARDSRIRLYGFLPKAEITALQTRCDVLVNPRPNTDAFTQYSFPSKTMEYLLSGSKVVMMRLAGVGEEYYNFIRVIPENTVESLRQTLTDAVADTEFYQARWRQQVEWITACKNAAAQVRPLRESRLLTDEME